MVLITSQNFDLTQNHLATGNRTTVRSSFYYLSMPGTPTLSNINVVIVEDNPDIRTSVGGFLQRQGVAVVTAADAFEGLKAVKEHRPDLVPSDISLPLWNGFPLLQEIRALELKQGRACRSLR